MTSSQVIRIVREEIDAAISKALALRNSPTVAEVETIIELTYAGERP